MYLITNILYIFKITLASKQIGIQNTLTVIDTTIFLVPTLLNLKETYLIDSLVDHVIKLAHLEFNNFHPNQ